MMFFSFFSILQHSSTFSNLSILQSVFVFSLLFMFSSNTTPRRHFQHIFIVVPVLIFLLLKIFSNCSFLLFFGSSEVHHCFRFADNLPASSPTSVSCVQLFCSKFPCSPLSPQSEDC